MQISRLHLMNFRCFDDLELEFTTSSDGHGGLTLLVAMNGEGKTSILDAISVALGPFIGKMPGARGAAFSPDDLTRRHGNVAGPLALSADFIPTAANSPHAAFTIRRELSSSRKRPTTTIRDAKPLIRLAEELFAQESQAVPWPLLAYYGDSHLPDAGHVTLDMKASALKRGRAYGYVDAMSPYAGYHEFRQWYGELCFGIWLHEHQLMRNNPLFTQQELDWHRLLRRIVDQALKQAMAITGWSGLELNGDKRIMAIHADTGDAVPWESLSAGNRRVIGMVADLAHRCCLLNPWAGEATLEQTAGIVLIDEVEVHLHPAWQQRILPLLQSIFPRIQFIVTTHSPQVVSSVPKECVRILKDGKRLSLDVQTEGVESQYILTEIFGTSPASESDFYVRLLRDYAELEAQNQGDTERAHTMRQQLFQHFGKQYPPLQRIEIHRNFFARHRGGENA